MAITYQGTVASYPIQGNDALLQNLFVIENGIASRVNVIIRRLVLQNDAVIALTSVMPIVKTSRITGTINDGIILDKCPFDTDQTSDSNVKLRASIAVGTPVTATAGQPVWGKFSIRLHSIIQKVIAPDAAMLPVLIADTGKEYIVKPGEALLIQVVGAAATSNTALTNNWFVNAMWEEDSLPTFSISGVVTLNSAPVAGAKVIVLQASDKYMANAILQEVKTTNSSGEWSSTIRSGMIGAAFVQYKDNGSLYTAPGSPFLEA